MSTILDSLQKSSEQRNDSKSSIDNFNFAQKSNDSKNNSLKIILLFAVVIAAYLAYDFWQNNNNDDRDANTNNAPKTIAQQDKNPAKKIKPKKAKPNNNEVKEELLRREAEKNAVAEIVLGPAPKNQKPEPVVRNGVAVKPEENKSPTKSSNSSRPVLTAEQDKKRSLKERLSNPAIRPKIDRKITKPNTKQHKQQVAKKPKQTKPGVRKQKYLYVYQLPFSIRKDIPKFKLNVHIFDENPKNRMAIINGEKFVIDDMIEEHALVKDIIPEGVVLEIEGTQFIIPKL